MFCFMAQACLDNSCPVSLKAINLVVWRRRRAPPWPLPLFVAMPTGFRAFMRRLTALLSLCSTGLIAAEYEVAVLVKRTIFTWIRRRGKSPTHQFQFGNPISFQIGRAHV